MVIDLMVLELLPSILFPRNELPCPSNLPLIGNRRTVGTSLMTWIYLIGLFFSGVAVPT
ncbi:hypothetical protein CL55_00009300 [Polynucleobacter duraquae]|uniref:Uncharacterized protein n=1 Tax=Polynucleobacter duraquae TaxID=1835254 RepID=A0A0E3V180_9BURK|nr:hypothetical protein CL55_00009300 [Polynucleobacter duraquae]